MKFLQVKWTGLETREKRNSRSSFIYHSISTLYGRRNTCFCSFLMSSSKPTSMTWVPEPPTENEPSLPTQPTPQMLLRNSPEDVLWTGLSGFSTLTTLPWNRVALFGRWRVRDQKCGDHHLVEQSRCLVPATAPLLGLVRWCQHTSNQSSLFHIMHRTHYLFIFQHGPENQSFHCNELWQDGIVRQTTSAMTSSHIFVFASTSMTGCISARSPPVLLHGANTSSPHHHHMYLCALKCKRNPF